MTHRLTLKRWEKNQFQEMTLIKFVLLCSTIWKWAGFCLLVGATVLVWAMVFNLKVTIDKDIEVKSKDCASKASE